MKHILLTILAIALVGCGTPFTGDESAEAGAADSAGSAGTPEVSAGSGGSETGKAGAAPGGSGGSGSTEAGAAGEASGGAGSEAGTVEQGGMPQGGGSAGLGGGSPQAGSGGTSQGGMPQGGSPQGGTHQGGSAGTPQGGTGSVAGSGGSGGTVVNVGGSAGIGGSAGTPGFCDQPGMLLCDTFDTNPIGPVSNEPWLSDAFCTTQANSITATQSFSPSHSLLNTASTNGACGLHANIGALKDFYVHARIRFAKATGSGDQFDNNVSFFSVDSNMDDERGLRVGVMGSNHCPTAGIDLHFASTDVWGCTGLEPTTEAWHCFELHVTTTNTTTTADLSVDGQDQAFTVNGLPVTSVTQPAIATSYLNVSTITFANSYKPAVYVDDVAVSSQPMGCQ